MRHVINLPALFYDQRGNLTDVFDTFAQQMFNDFSFPLMKDKINTMTSGFPKVDIVDYPDRVTIYTEIATIPKDDIQIKVEDRILSISGKSNKSAEKPYEDGKVLVKELKHSQFKRSFHLGEDLTEEIEAKHENGLLTIDIKKKVPEINQSKTIEIK